MAKINSDTKIIVSRYCYDISKDRRLLIPFYQGTKIGFIDKDENIIVEPQFDFVLDDFIDDHSLVRVGKSYGEAYDHKTKQPTTSLRKRFGLLKSNGEFLLPMEYEGISISEPFAKITIRSLQKGYAVIDWSGNIVIPFGRYNYIDGIEYGYARVKVGGGINGLKDENGLWGVINDVGDIVVSAEYKYIEKFDNNIIGPYSRVEGFDRNFEFHFLEGELKNDGAYMAEGLKWESDLEFYQRWQENQAEQACESEMGVNNGSYAQDVMRYSDQDIDDAFDGDPEAYWNID